MKLYKRARFEFYRRYSKPEREYLQWAVSLKPGDLVNGCTTWPFNTVVKKIEINRMHHGQRGYIVSEVDVFTTDDRQHTYPGGGCVEKPYTPDEIRAVLVENGTQYGSDEAYITYLDEQIKLGWTNEKGKIHALDMYHRAVSGLPVCDAEGKRLPEDLVAAMAGRT